MSITHENQAFRRDAALPKSASGADRAGRPFLALVGLFLLAFAFAMGAQIKTQHDNSVASILAAQSASARLVAERVNSGLASALGASAVAGGLANSNDAALAAAAASSAPARAAAIVHRSGEISAITSAGETALASAAVRAAGQSALWAGAPDLGAARTAPVLVRTINDRAIVTIIDPAALLAEFDASARIMITSPGGGVVYVSPALQAAGDAARGRLIAAARSGSAALFSDATGAWAGAAAEVSTGGFQVLTAAPAPTSWALWVAALARFALLAAAPLAALGVLFVLMRQNGQRAALAEAEAARSETHFRIAADGAKVGVLEWRPGADEVQLSEQAARLLGARRDTLALAEFLDLVHGEDRYNLDEEFRRARQSGVLDARFRIARAAGFAVIEARGASVEDANGRAETRLFGWIVDVTPAP